MSLMHLKPLYAAVGKKAFPSVLEISGWEKVMEAMKPENGLFLCSLSWHYQNPESAAINEEHESHQF